MFIILNDTKKGMSVCTPSLVIYTKTNLSTGCRLSKSFHESLV
jgi:hypothetical protein